MDRKAGLKQAAGVTLGVAALAFTFACNSTPNVAGAAAQPLQQAGQPGAPIVVSCEPHQRTIVRPAIVNGAAMSQVECVAAEPAAQAIQPSAYAAAPAPVPVRSYRASRPAAADYGGLEDAQVVPVRTGGARPVRTSQVIYDERPVKKPRSVGKSAVIIGSSAGAGAGVGAAIGGKKGALIGAAIGGGGAAIWDQVTRRK
jgi:hypothetical protein